MHRILKEMLLIPPLKDVTVYIKKHQKRTVTDGRGQFILLLKGQFGRNRHLAFFNGRIH